MFGLQPSPTTRSLKDEGMNKKKVEEAEDVKKVERSGEAVSFSVQVELLPQHAFRTVRGTSAPRVVYSQSP